MHIPSPVNPDSSDPSNLNQCFEHEIGETKYSIAWTSLGNPKGVPVILLHGTPWSSRVWAPIAKTLASTGKYHVHLLDNPGYGSSTAAPTSSPDSPSHAIHPGDATPDITPRAAADCFSAILKHWSFSSAPHIVAHDVGGQIILRALLKNSVKVASLCLVDVVALSPMGSPFFKLVGQQPDIFDKMPPMVFEGALRGYVNTATTDGTGRTLLDKSIEDAIVAPWIDRMGGVQGQRGWIRQAVQSHQRLVEEVEGEYYGKLCGTMPVKIVWGDDDVWIPKDRASALEKKLGAKEVVIVQGAGHLIMIDQPSQLTWEVASWLQTVAN